MLGLITLGRLFRSAVIRMPAQFVQGFPDSFFRCVHFVSFHFGFPYARARAFNRLDSMMSKETDPSKLDRLASAQAKVAEQGRILAGRPFPRSRKPSGVCST